MSNYVLVGAEPMVDVSPSRAMPWIFAASIAAVSITAAGAAGSVSDLAKVTLASARHASYVVDQIADTALIGGETSFDVADGHFEASMTAFYGHLLQAQQPLGHEFEAVLAKNLWDLYAD
ncbi:hypothetical protein [Caballeronia sp. dw_276]|uniref:hypothetical protein n=1 Tax=Caballeronia sp. dw_276 TaxID=2719795 RepID=UPI001BD637A2|nr:hypothetical protein [Caballeronia sp. dw_276]